MKDYELNVAIEPIDEYDKAKEDLIQAGISISKLNQQQKEQLAKELFGAAQADFVIRFMQSYYR